MRLTKVMTTLAVLLCVTVVQQPRHAAASTASLFHRELDLPVKGKSQRVTQRRRIEKGDTLVLFDEEGPGCVLHWWLTYSRKKTDPRDRAHDMRVRIYYDGSESPDVDVTLAQYFSILLERNIYPVDNAAIKVLPKNACNSYFPMPFRKMRMELLNNTQGNVVIWFMADWQEYPETTAITSLRFRAVHRAEFPAEPAGSYLMADLTGRGFIAGMVKAVRVKDKSDAWFHTGGDLWMLDGETDPTAIRGIGGEDVFNMSFGIWDVQSEWVGVPFLEKVAANTALGSGYEGIMYRIFGPSPVWFDASAVVRFGSKANDLESVIYAYVKDQDAPEAITPREWRIAGPFKCEDDDDFNKTEWADGPVKEWPSKHTADFGQYVRNDKPAEFSIPMLARSEHTWCDFTRWMRGKKKTNGGTQPSDVSAYAAATLSVRERGKYDIEVAFDDWMTLWIDGRKIYTGKHDSGFETETIPCDLDGKDIEIRVKLSNKDNFQWRLWTFSLKLKKKG
ncbi:DUF2961 domain-containing protein [Candidatus Hydrogenedentota bacterium]